MSSDHLVRPTNADPRLIDLPIFGQPLPDSSVPGALTRPDSPRAPSYDEADVDWGVVASLRALASKQLSQAVSAESSRLDKTAQTELGRAIVLDLIESTMADRVNGGRRAWSPVDQAVLAQAVFDSLFRLGRLQPLVDDDRVENIIIAGHDNVMLELVDGSLVEGPPVADSDAELIDFLVFLASRSEVNARGFSEAQPRLHLRLDGGSRLAAAAWVTPRPSVVIRRHRLMQVTLADLVERGMLSPLLASFLRAAVRARKSIVVSGCQGAGKTTLVRAPCAARSMGTRRSARSRPSTSSTSTSWVVTGSCTPGSPGPAPANVAPTADWLASSISTKR